MGMEDRPSEVMGDAARQPETSGMACGPGAQALPPHTSIALSVHSAVIKEAKVKGSPSDPKPKGGKGAKGFDKSSGKGVRPQSQATHTVPMPGPPPPGLSIPASSIPASSRIQSHALEEVQKLPSRIDSIESRQDRLEQASKDQEVKIDNMSNDMSANFAKLFSMLKTSTESAEAPDNDKRFRSEGAASKQ